MATISDVKKIVGRTQDENGNPRDETIKEFTAQWKNPNLTDKDKEELKSGVENGTMTY